MAHHWRPSDQLEPATRPGEWVLLDRGIRVGSVELGRLGGTRAFRARSRGGELVGYAWEIEDACDRLWAWWVRTRKGASMSAWPWPPIRISADEWIVMRNEPGTPRAVIRRFVSAGRTYYRAVTWAPDSEQRVLIGRYPSLQAADDAVLADPPQDVRRGPDKDGRRRTGEDRRQDGPQRARDERRRA